MAQGFGPRRGPHRASDRYKRDGEPNDRLPVELTVQVKTVSLNQTHREHWAVTRKRSRLQRDVTAATWKSVLGAWSPDPPVRVTLTRIAFSDGLDDHDNLRGALKHVADEIADLIGVDDKSEGIQWEYGQERSAKAGQFAVRVRIERMGGK